MSDSSTQPHFHDFPGVLSANSIKRAISERLIVIHPYNPENLSVNSYDVTLGEFFYRESDPVTTAPIYNIYDEKHIKKVWGLPQRAPTYEDLMHERLLPSEMRTVNPKDRIILLAPGETILGHTNEFIGGTVGAQIAPDGPYARGVTTKMHARSSFGRSLIGVCKCAGFGDVGYINRWTMEITSFSRHHYIPLVVGRRIAQIEFINMENIQEPYKGKYQEMSELLAIVEAWNPVMMLPSLHKEKL